MRNRPSVLLVLIAAVGATLSACGQGTPASPAAVSLSPTAAPTAAAAAEGSSLTTTGNTSPSTSSKASTKPAAGAKAGAASTKAATKAPTKAKAATTGTSAKAVYGNSAGHAAIPAAARAVDTSHPSRVVGRGTPASCTSAAVVAAVAKGGIIRFNCGRKPVTITLTKTAKVVNTSKRVVLDGRGLVTLSGAGKRRIVYMDTCDPAQIWTTSHCQDQETPALVIQNMTFINGNSTGHLEEGGGGGAIQVRGGRLKIVNSGFFGNRCDANNEIGGAAVRVLSQYHNRPVYVVNSTFKDGRCSSGGGVASIGVSWTILNSLFTDNKAIGGAAGHAGGGGGAIYNDGLNMTLQVSGTLITRNHAHTGGGSIFFTSNDHSGIIHIDHSVLRKNPNDGFDTAGAPSIFYIGRTAVPVFVSSTVTK